MYKKVMKGLKYEHGYIFVRGGDVIIQIKCKSKPSVCDEIGEFIVNSLLNKEYNSDVINYFKSKIVYSGLDQNFHFDSDYEISILMRGWGFMQYLFDDGSSAEKQDELGKYISDVLNQNILDSKINILI